MAVEVESAGIRPAESVEMRAAALRGGRRRVGLTAVRSGPAQACTVQKVEDEVCVWPDTDVGECVGPRCRGGGSVGVVGIGGDSGVGWIV